MFAAFRNSYRNLVWTPCRLVHSPVPINRMARVHRMARPRIALLGVVGGSLYLWDTMIHADPDNMDRGSKRPTSLSTLLRSYVVYTLCSVPVLVDYSPAVLAALTSVPGVNRVTEAIVRSTFFAQFVGGDTAQDTLPLMTQLRANNTGVLLAYSVESDQAEAERRTERLRDTLQLHKQNVLETIRCIDIAGDFEDRWDANAGLGRKTWVAIKLVGLYITHAMDSVTDVSQNSDRTFTLSTIPY